MSQLRLAVILNPHSNRQRAAHQASHIMAMLSHFGLEASLFKTTHVGHATSLAQQCVAEGTWDGIIAAGGDGTINEIVNGMAGSQLPLSFVPLGTGNDFVKMLKLPANSIVEAIRAIANNQLRQIDLGMINEHWFINGVGIGLDANVAIEAQKLKRIKGGLVYIIAVLKSILRYEARDLLIETDDLTLQQRINMATVGNGGYHGGGFWVTPAAKIDDGLLDVCLTGEQSRWSMVRDSARVRQGTHGDLPSVTMLKTRTFKLYSERGVPVHVDGEVFSASLHDISISIQPAALTIRV
ncbi:diacylglycerol/lipid kinase family protein [Herpetosiphon giganteus]|uniref:diacylglycerol/lipid kinase family protein n=1 Tax=Herpetosiphon giganteus TaxID=2029754 RepID=UPI001956D412|nr:diacylglycerol kinase family protein [Herpetosiphon giganteus]MBM7846470.1 YegS/Rv2252/BmrU family lipid kinase [Herpetosiphon giganteus]